MASRWRPSPAGGPDANVILVTDHCSDAPMALTNTSIDKRIAAPLSNNRRYYASWRCGMACGVMYDVYG